MDRLHGEGETREGWGLRVSVGVLGLVSLIVLAIAPFFTSPERMSRGEALEQRQEQSSPVRH